MTHRKPSRFPALTMSAREVARIALEKLIADGRIHPTKIEEMVEKAKREVEHRIARRANRASSGNQRTRYQQ